MFQYSSGNIFLNLLTRSRLRAVASLSGGKDYPDIRGLVKFYASPHRESAMYGGAIVEAEIFNLPAPESGGDSGFFGFHIHENGDCSDNFSHAGSHFNPSGRPHPYHAGDLPPLLSSHGYAWTAFYDDRIQIEDISGRSVIIHRNADDFTSQPSGNAGEMIACGVIRGGH